MTCDQNVCRASKNVFDEQFVPMTFFKSQKVMCAHVIIPFFHITGLNTTVIV